MNETRASNWFWLSHGRLVQSLFYRVDILVEQAEGLLFGDSVAGHNASCVAYAYCPHACRALVCPEYAALEGAYEGQAFVTCLHLEYLF